MTLILFDFKSLIAESLVIPSSMSASNGGVVILPFLTTKIFSALPSAT